MDAQRALTDAREALAAAAAELAARGIPPERLATTVPPRRALGFIPRPATMRRAGEGFLLGAILVTVDGGAFDPGTILRATRQVLPGHQAASAQERRALRQTALDAGFREGTTVVLDSRPLPLDDESAMRAEAGPLVLTDDGVLVRWIPTAPDSALRPLGDYLQERLDLSRPRAAGERPR
ncbi:MAG: hypothetical protein KJ659_11935 [Actinobacteria bacterium]|nr:hypothetical protein [Actinomycetota bacterium]MBU1607972.1 hypothetical protein [Actinomycetota bacterium]MBU2316148.1 hypothetical protein [Actinomycetota bacterium]MBU2386180.1 hypothetical protein [Actinomycetota bacterium]